METHGDLLGERLKGQTVAGNEILLSKRYPSLLVHTYDDVRSRSLSHTNAAPVNNFAFDHVKLLACNPTRWNHSAVGVFAVPHWKVFVFGGNSGNLAEGGNPQVGLTCLNLLCSHFRKKGGHESQSLLVFVDAVTSEKVVGEFSQRLGSLIGQANTSTLQNQANIFS